MMARCAGKIVARPSLQETDGDSRREKAQHTSFGSGCQVDRLYLELEMSYRGEPTVAVIVEGNQKETNVIGVLYSDSSHAAPDRSIQVYFLNAKPDS